MDKYEESYLKANSDACPSKRSEAEELVRQYSAKTQKQERAAKFFRENPAFDEFIQLIRAGVIGI